MGLETYRRMRDFQRTREPRGAVKKSSRALSFVVQKHAARSLHYDFRLELDGVLKSWAVPKGPSLDPSDKRLAVHVEDHPLEYGSFEGTIPEGEYGAGKVELWDRGRWIPEGDPHEGYRQGSLKFRLEGKKLRGGWALVRMGGKAAGEKKENWLLIKERDPTARSFKQAGSPKAASETAASTAASQKTSSERTSSKKVASVASGKAASRAASRNAASKKAASRVSSTPKGRMAKLRLRPEDLSLGKKAPLPEFVPPQLATLVDQPPPGDEWFHEIKLDGYRILTHIDRGKVRLITRGQKDWTARFGGVAKAVGALPVEKGLLDGEVVVLDEKGISSFQALQNALSLGDAQEVVYYAFDLLHLNGADLRALPLEERKRLLSALRLRSDGLVRYSDHVEGQGDRFYREACRRALEGIICKRRDRPYLSGRSRDWLKVKCLSSQEFVIGGFTEPKGARSELGALLLGVYGPGGKLVYTGRVGTGFTEVTLRDLRARLKKLETSEPPFSNPPRGPDARGVQWVEPKLVGEVAFTAWTNDGLLRHPTFHGLREDKTPREVLREQKTTSPKTRVRENSGPPARQAEGTVRLEAGKARKVPSRRAKRTTVSGEKGNTKANAEKRNTEKGNSKSSPTSTGTARAAAKADEAGSQRGPTEVAGVKLTNPDRVLYPDQGITKLSLARFYEEIADWILPHVIDRPLSLVRCPEGQKGSCFYQKHAGSGAPPALKPIQLEEEGGKGSYIYIEDLAGLISLVQMGVLEIHPWGARVKKVERPDLLTLDLDPSPEVGWEQMIETAKTFERRLKELGLRGFPKLTGGKGLHVVVPLEPRNTWDEVRAFCRGLAEELVRSDPKAYTAKAAKSGRKGKIFIDYLRNARGATAVAPYSTRAMAGAPVATPVTWKELDQGMKSNQFTVQTLPRRLKSRRGDPWAEFFELRQTLTKQMQKEVSPR